MQKSLTLVILLVGVLAAIDLRLPRASSHAETCLYVVPTLEEIITEANIIGIADVIEVGGLENQAPTLTPTVTPTYDPSVTPSPRNFRGQTTDLRGVGAKLDMVTLYAGDAESPFSVDATTRRRIEEIIRLSEAIGLSSDCPLDGGVWRYAPAVRYLVFAETSEELGTHTTARYLIEGSDIVLQDNNRRAADTGVFYGMHADTYHRYFDGLSAEFNTDDTRVYIREGRIPLSSVLRAIEGIRQGEIAPPDTGSAGLATER